MLSCVFPSETTSCDKIELADRMKIIRSKSQSQSKLCRKMGGFVKRCYLRGMYFPRKMILISSRCGQCSRRIFKEKSELVRISWVMLILPSLSPLDTSEPRVHTVCVRVCVCVCVSIVIPYILDVRFVDVPVGVMVTQEEVHTGFIIHLPSVVLA